MCTLYRINHINLESPETVQARYKNVMSQSEEVCVELSAFQQLNGPEDPQLLSTVSSNGAEATIQGNGECNSRHTAGVLERTKTYLCKNWQHLELVLLAMIIVVVLILLLLPTIFYHLPLPPVSTLHSVIHR